MFYAYSLETGLFLGTGFAVEPRTPEAVEAHTPDGCALYEGVVDTLCQRVDLQTGELAPYLPPEPLETDAYRFEWDGRQWQPIAKAQVVAERARVQRASLLAKTDWIVTRALERAEAVPAQWLAYRQALRDVPQQAGFPTSISWPAPPEEG